MEAAASQSKAAMVRSRLGSNSLPLHKSRPRPRCEDVVPEEKAGGADFAGVGGAIERRAGESRGEVLRAERVLDAALGGGPVVVALGFTGAIVLATGARGGELAAR